MDSVTNTPAGTCQFPPDRLKVVEELLEKSLARIVPSRRPHTSRAGVIVDILLTGSTGALGSYLLQLFNDDSRVHHVYTHNRPSASQSIYERHTTSFREVGLDTSVLSSPKITFLEGDISQDHLGLDVATYNKLLESVTIIVHNAWKLDFKAPVSAFIPLITGSVNLINFAYQLSCSNPRFVFSSSITSVQNFGFNGMVPEAIMDDPRVSLGCGYGEAKFITERLIASSHLETCSVRIPQLYGGPPHFIWPITGWLALFVKSSIPLGKLPLVSGLIDWLPMSDTALIMRDVVLHEGKLPRALNLQHPKPTAFNDILAWVQEVLLERSQGTVALGGLPLSHWLEGLRSLHCNGLSFREIPVLRIQTFLQDVSERERSAVASPIVGALPILDTRLANSISPSLGRVDVLEKSFVKGWVDYWVKEGILVLHHRDHSHL
ncbi:hypothetical protein ONZ45_g13878 [Pleurotus djamor]|nr:hypothetical protein ONZ45_g13878 [Pleurotus djamor]